MARVPGQMPQSIVRTVPGAVRRRRAEAGDWIALGEASRLLGISEGTLRRWADEGRVSVFTTPGGHRRFSRHVLRSLLPAARAHRPPLSALGASPDRISRAYRGRARALPPAWLLRLPEADVATLRERGRQIVERLLAHLDAPDDAEASEQLRRACELSAAYGEAAAERGATLTDAIETFLHFRAPFVAELAEVSRRRGLDTREATELLVAAETAVDRLLLSTLDGFMNRAGDGSAERAGRLPDERIGEAAS